MTSDNIVSLKTNDDKSSKFRDLESDICDLERWVDLTLHLSCEEIINREIISKGGSVTHCTIEHLVDLVKDLKKKYYQAWAASVADVKA